MPPLRDRIAGAIFGGAVGDAMGRPTEGLRSFEEIRLRFPPAGVTGFEAWWDVDGRKVAPYTDDTDMALVVFHALLDARDADEGLDATMFRMARDFVAWSRKPDLFSRGPGGNTLAGCARLQQGADWSEGGQPGSNTCGSIMRVYPFALIYMDDPERAVSWAAQHSKLTHRTPMALAACAGMTAAMLALLRGEGVDVALEGLLAAAEAHDRATATIAREAIDAARRGVEPEGVLDRIQGWHANEALAGAAYLFARNPDDPRAVILEGANSPGDSDSLASIAGTLAGAHCGVEAIPADWRRDVEGAELYNALAERVAKLHRA